MGAREHYGRSAVAALPDECKRHKLLEHDEIRQLQLAQRECVRLDQGAQPTGLLLRLPACRGEHRGPERRAARALPHLRQEMDSICHGSIRGHQRSSEVIRGHQKSSEVIRGHQRSSEVIRGEHLHAPAVDAEHCEFLIIWHLVIRGH